jgi:hypothetical protein
MGINSFPPTGGAGNYEFPSELIDPVSKFRISQPENLIDTDFEYGLQPTKWETVELINNTPSFFSKSGDTTIDGISSIITNAGTREIIVRTELDHGLAVGIPINVTGTKSITADGSYIINSIPDTKTFTYLCKDDQDETASILDLYSSIITGEFFQGSQLRVSDSEGIITDAAGTSQLTVTTNSTHGFGENTPFYFLNLNSTVAQEFQAANTASKTFDASNSATAQTFDGSNTLSSFNIDWSNSAVEGGTVSNITSTDIANSRITVSHTTENFANLPLGTPLYYNVSATSGYFNTNPRGVVFLKTTTSLGTSTSTFQVSLVPDGEPVLFTTSLSGTFQRANQARTFAGNNINPLTQTVLDVQIGPSFIFDGGNQGFSGESGSITQTNGLATITSFSGSTINVSTAGNVVLDYYVGSMVRYDSTGAGASPLNKGETYFIHSITGSPGSYQVQISNLPGSASSPISLSGGTGTQTLQSIGVSLTKDIIHIKNSNFQEDDMIEYTFPANGNFTSDFNQKFYFVDTAYDAHNYKLNNDVGFKPIIATGGTVTDFTADGRTWRAHTFTTTGTSNFVVTSPGGDGLVDVLIVAGGGSGAHGLSGGGGGGGVIDTTTNPLTPKPVVTAQTYSIVVGAGGISPESGEGIFTNNATNPSANGGNSSAFGLTAIGGGGAGSHREVRGFGLAGGSGGGGGCGPGGGAGGAAQQPTSSSGGYGNPGGSGTNSCGDNWPGGGGGGAAGPGQTPVNNNVRGGAGGPGIGSRIDGTLFFYGGGGGGAGHLSGNGAGNGGIGGGGGGDANSGTVGLGGLQGRNPGQNGFLYGSSNQPTTNSGADAGANTGGGGGGGAWARGFGGNGGSGIVIIRYPLTGVNIAGITATGGTVTEVTEQGVVYKVHAFYSTGVSNFTISSIESPDFASISYLVVGGGGGGATHVGGGGGGGGFLEGSYTPTIGSTNITVGDGGGIYQNGGNSIIPNVATALGGGYGGGWDSGSLSVWSIGNTGASSGGAGSLGSNAVSGGDRIRVNAAAATPGQGNPGGSGIRFTTDNANSHNTGGGGGALNAGSPGSDVNSASAPRANGGDGRPSNILGTLYYFGGGGGGSTITSCPGGNGGLGGAGGGHTWASGNPGAAGASGINAGQPGGSGSGVGRRGGNAGANTGGGGGGAYATDSSRDVVGRRDLGGVGGSGIVVLRYPVRLAG